MSQVLRPWSPKKIRRIPFDPLKIRNLVWDKGLDVLWERASQCPCGQSLELGGIVGHTGGHHESCLGCKGNGVLYHAAGTIKAAMGTASQDPDRFKLYGAYTRGMASFTVLPETLPAFLDRLTVQSGRMVYTETRVHGSSDTVALRYPVLVPSLLIGSSSDPTVQEPVSIGVLYCRKASELGVLHGTEFEQGTHFAVDDAGQVVWDSDSSPDVPVEGERVSYTYFMRPTYIVVDAPFSYLVTPTMVKRPEPIEEEVASTVDGRLEWLGLPA